LIFFVREIITSAGYRAR